MKPPGMKPFISPKPPNPVPSGGELKRGAEQAGVSAFAYHPPTRGDLGHRPARMMRPRGGHGPHN